MRLSVLGGGIAGAAALLAIGGLAIAARDAAVPLFAAGHAGSTARLDDATRTLVYRLDRTAPPLRFTLSRPTETVRIISQPSIDPAAWSRADGWTYGFTAILHDQDGAVIARHPIYSRGLHPARLRPFKRPERFRRDSDERIALQDDVVLVAPRPIAAVELSFLYAQPAVRGINTRVYERLPFIGNTALAAFSRRTPAEQATLARADALPAAVLPDAERAALMSNRWKVLGPDGIAGEDYTVSVVYERRAQEGRQAR